MAPWRASKRGGSFDRFAHQIERASMRAVRTFGLPVERADWPHPSPELRDIRRIMARSRRVLRDAAPPLQPRVLFMSKRGEWAIHIARESVIAWALRLRGAKTRFWYCSGDLPICDVTTFRSGPPMPCEFCRPYARHIFRAFNLESTWLADQVPPDEMASLVTQLWTATEEPDEFEFGRLPIGKMAQISTRWHLNRSDISDDRSKIAHRRFATTGAIVAVALQRLLDQERPDVIVMINGLFLPEQIMTVMARERGIRIITHEAGYLDDTVYFAHNAEACRYEIDEYWSEVKEIPLTAAEENWVRRYMEARSQGLRETSMYWPSMSADLRAIANDLGLELDRPTTVAFSNVTWDTSVQGRDVGFDGMTDWLRSTIEHFVDGSRGQLVIRVHPGEIRVPGFETTERVIDDLTKHFPRLPGWIKLVGPESPISSYRLIEMSDLVLVYASTIGLEAAVLGAPTVITGQTHYRDKGFTLDISSKDEYRDLLGTPSSALRARTLEQREMAWRYAFRFFHDVMLPFDLVERVAGMKPRFCFDSLADLLPGSNETLDVICSGILDEKPFRRRGLREEALLSQAGL